VRRRQGGAQPALVEAVGLPGERGAQELEEAGEGAELGGRVRRLGPLVRAHRALRGAAVEARGTRVAGSRRGSAGPPAMTSTSAPRAAAPSARRSCRTVVSGG